MTLVEQNLMTARRYLALLERGVVSAELKALLHPNITQHEFPNPLSPNGITRDLATMLEGVERGKQVLSAQTYDIQNAFGAGNQAILEIVWRGTLAIPIGKLVVGDVMTAYFATIFEFEDGKIIAQRNYDCFEPF